MSQHYTVDDFNRLSEIQVEGAVKKLLRYRYREKALDRIEITQKLMPYGYQFEKILAAIDRLVDKDEIYYVSPTDVYPSRDEVFWGSLHAYESPPYHYTKEEEAERERQYSGWD